MTAVLALLLLNAVLGAWDTLWYHEYRTRLVANLTHTRTELRLHAARDGVYVGLYGFLAWARPTGLLVLLVGLALLAEVIITFADFVVEDRDRPAIGGMAPGERVLHSAMAVVYGSMLANLLPVLAAGLPQPTGISMHSAPIWMSLAATAAAIGIAASGLRDGLALCGVEPIWSPIRAAGSPADSGGERNLSGLTEGAEVREVRGLVQLNQR